MKLKNIHKKTVKSFGNQWTKFDQKNLNHLEAKKMFESYFSIVDWKKINKNPKVLDAGCGVGRWAKFIAPKVTSLTCIDPSDSINVARKNCNQNKNINFLKSSINDLKFKKNYFDFIYALGVVHHMPNTFEAIQALVRLLKPGSPLLLYIYYDFENRPYWYKSLWTITDFFRKTISILPEKLKFLITDLISIFIYYPIAKIYKLLSKMNLEIKNFPLKNYSEKSFYTMRTDSRDRFGTLLEKRFSKKKIKKMMAKSNLKNIKFKNSTPYWTVIGYKNK